MVPAGWQARTFVCPLMVTVLEGTLAKDILSLLFPTSVQFVMASICFTLPSRAVRGMLRGLTDLVGEESAP